MLSAAPPEGPFSRWASAGFRDVIPIIPPRAPLTSKSGVKPDQLGKIPGRYHDHSGLWAGYSDWSNEVATPAHVEEWNTWPGAGIGMIGRDFKAADNDVTDPVLNAAIREVQAAMLPIAPRRIGSAPKCLSMWRCSGEFGKVRIEFTAPDGSAAGMLELLGDSQQWLVDGLHAKTGQPYSYQGGHPLEIGAAGWPEITIEQLRAFANAAIEKATTLGYTAEITMGKAALLGREYDSTAAVAEGEIDEQWAVEYARWEIKNARGAWADPPSEGNRNDRAFQRGCRLWELGVPEAEAIDLLTEWCQLGQAPDEPIEGLIGRAYHHDAATNEFGSCLPPKPATGSEVFGDAGASGPPKRKAILRRGSSVKAKSIAWLWRGYLARGKFHIFGGHKGAGKSTTGIDWLAILSRGGSWPDGSAAPRGRVLIWSSEDDIDDTLHPRFLAAGGDPDMVEYLSGTRNTDGSEHPFDPAHDIAALLEAIRELPDLVAIMVDPIVSAVAGDGNSNNDVRRALQPLVDLAAERGIAVIGITHFSKGTQGKSPIERITGSLAYGAISRIAYAAVRGENKDDPRLLVRIAANISGEDGGGFEYRIETVFIDGANGEKIETSRVRWSAVLTGSAAKLLDELESGGDKSAVQKAMAWLRKTLEENGPMHVSAVLKRGEAYGHSRATIYRARELMGEDIEVVPNLGGDGRECSWKLDRTRAFRDATPSPITDPNAEQIRRTVEALPADCPATTMAIAKCFGGGEEMARRIEAKARAGELAGWWEENGGLVWCGDESFASAMRQVRF
jgi:putative DNA primase/helicase